MSRNMNRESRDKPRVFDSHSGIDNRFNSAPLPRNNSRNESYSHPGHGQPHYSSGPSHYQSHGYGAPSNYGPPPSHQYDRRGPPPSGPNQSSRAPPQTTSYRQPYVPRNQLPSQQQHPSNNVRDTMNRQQTSSVNVKRDERRDAGGREPIRDNRDRDAGRDSARDIGRLDNREHHHRDAAGRGESTGRDSGNEPARDGARLGGGSSATTGSASRQHQQQADSDSRGGFARERTTPTSQQQPRPGGVYQQHQSTPGREHERTVGGNFDQRQRYARNNSGELYAVNDSVDSRDQYTDRYRPAQQQRGGSIVGRDHRGGSVGGSASMTRRDQSPSQRAALSGSSDTYFTSSLSGNSAAPRRPARGNRDQQPMGRDHVGARHGTPMQQPPRNLSTPPQSHSSYQSSRGPQQSYSQHFSTSFGGGSHSVYRDVYTGRMGGADGVGKDGPTSYNRYSSKLPERDNGQNRYSQSFSGPSRSSPYAARGGFTSAMPRQDHFSSAQQLARPFNSNRYDGGNRDGMQSSNRFVGGQNQSNSFFVQYNNARKAPQDSQRDDDARRQLQINNNNRGGGLTAGDRFRGLNNYRPGGTGGAGRDFDGMSGNRSYVSNTGTNSYYNRNADQRDPRALGGNRYGGSERRDNNNFQPQQSRTYQKQQQNRRGQGSDGSSAATSESTRRTSTTTTSGETKSGATDGGSDGLQSESKSGGTLSSLDLDKFETTTEQQQLARDAVEEDEGEFIESDLLSHDYSPWNKVRHVISTLTICAELAGPELAGVVQQIKREERELRDRANKKIRAERKEYKYYQLDATDETLANDDEMKELPTLSKSLEHLIKLKPLRASSSSKLKDEKETASQDKKDDSHLNDDFFKEEENMDTTDSQARLEREEMSEDRENEEQNEFESQPSNRAESELGKGNSGADNVERSDESEHSEDNVRGMDVEPESVKVEIGTTNVTLEPIEESEQFGEERTRDAERGTKSEPRPAEEMKEEISLRDSQTTVEDARERTHVGELDEDEEETAKRLDREQEKRRDILMEYDFYFDHVDQVNDIKNIKKYTFKDFCFPRNNPDPYTVILNHQRLLGSVEQAASIFDQTLKDYKRRTMSIWSHGDDFVHEDEIEQDEKYEQDSALEGTDAPLDK